LRFFNPAIEGSVNTTTVIDWQQVRQELSKERTELFNRFVSDPANIRLAIRIRELDEQILQCAEHLQRA
jgi:hypothetical protein